MTENAPANWYAQPDGSQRYWDGAQWTEHIVPAVPSAAIPAPSGEVEAVPAASGLPSAAVAPVPFTDVATPDARPWWKKKRVLIPAGALAALVGLSAAGAAAGGGDADRDVAASPPPSPAATATAPAVMPAEVPATIVMPDLVGLNLQEAQDSLQALGSYFLDQEDALGEGRVQLVDSNWQVCSQEPASGAEMPLEATVLLAAVKLDEACPGAAPVEAEPADADDKQVEADKPAEKPAKAADEGSDETVAQQNARRSAENYLSFTAFSRSGLIEQLEYEGYSESDAKYGVDATGADWNKQAVDRAESYLGIAPFSQSGLVDQLEYEGFTGEQAQHGASKVDADWNEQAVRSAESYLDMMAFSRSGLIDQLEFEGYTSAQATHAVNKVGL